MSKAPAFQLYAADFYMDTVGWSATEVGAYFRLLLHEWVSGPLPDNMMALSRIAGIDHKTMGKFWLLSVGKKFVKNANQEWENSRLEQTRKEQEDHRKKLIESGRKGGMKTQGERKEHSSEASSEASSEIKALQSSSSTSSKKNKKSIGDKSPSTKFIPPTLDEVTAYCQERGKGVNPEKWFNHYTANGWMVGRTKMVDWKAGVRTWEADETNNNNGSNGKNGSRPKSEAQKAWEAERAEYGDNPELYPPHLMTAEEKKRYLVNPEYNRRDT